MVKLSQAKPEQDGWFSDIKLNQLSFIDSSQAQCLPAAVASCCFAKINSAYPASCRQRRSAQCSKEICAAPAVHSLLCAITSLKAFSKILLCVFDLLWPTDSRGLLSFQAALSASSLAIALHQATPWQKGCPLPFCFPALLLASLRGRHRDLKPQVRRGNKTSFSAAIQS